MKARARQFIILAMANRLADFKLSRRNTDQ